ncbi:MAG: hypothetical protein GC137_08070 [Alphaproteobacteria bacterium]|nr:hypothetical protein [Alphaproteobacteria bacterium]
MTRKSDPNNLPEQEWSYFIESEEITAKSQNLNISAGKETYSAICSRLDLHSINSISAKIKLVRNSITKIIHIKGQIEASLAQKCVVTGEPVEESVSESFEAWFADDNQALSFAKAKRERMSRKERNEQPILEEEEDPESIIDGKIDLGELVIQYLSLSLNPYPRKDGVSFETQKEELDFEKNEVYENPFAALKNWKSGGDKET